MPNDVQVEIKVLDQASKSLAGLEAILDKITAAEKRVVAAADRAQSPLRQGSTQQLAKEEIAAEKQKQEVAMEKARLLNGNKIINNEKATGAASKAASQTAEKAGKIAQGVGQVAGGGSGALMGMAGKAGPAGMALAAGVVAFKAIVGQSTEALNTWNSGVLTGAQKNEALKTQFIPFYESLTRLREALNGTTEQLARNQRKLEFAKVVTNASTSYSSSRLGAVTEANEANRQRMAFSGLKGATATQYDRSTAKGEIASQDQDIRIQASDQATVARARRYGAAKHYQDMDGQAKGATSAREMQEIRARDAVRDANIKREEESRTGVRDKKGVNEANTRAQEELLKLQQLQQAEAEKIAKANEAGKAAVNAEREARAANLNVMKAEAEILKNKESRMATAAQKVGSMSTMDREMGKAMAVQLDEHLKAGGDIGDLPPSMVEAANPFMGQRIAKEREKSGEKTLREFEGENKGINVGDFEGDTLSQVRDKQFKVDTEIRVQAVLDEEKVATMTAEILSRQLAGFLKSIEAKFFAEIETFRIGKSDAYNSSTP